MKYNAQAMQAVAEILIAEMEHLVEQSLLVSVSDNTVCQETERFGTLQQEREAHWQEESQDLDWLQARQRQASPTPPKRLYGFLDRVMVPLQGNGGR